MATLIAVVIGIYLFFESFTAVNDMPQIKLRHVFREVKNIYTVKYIFIGLYSIYILYNAQRMTPEALFLLIPAVLCVINRTLYRLQYHTIPILSYIIMRIKCHLKDNK